MLVKYCDMSSSRRRAESAKPSGNTTAILGDARGGWGHALGNCSSITWSHSLFGQLHDDILQPNPCSSCRGTEQLQQSGGGRLSAVGAAARIRDP